MKLKKAVSLILVCLLIIIQFSFFSYSNVSYAIESKEENKARFGFELVSDKSSVMREEEFTVKTILNNFKNVENGLLAIGGKLIFNKDLLEVVDVKGLNTWNFASKYYNLNNFKFVADSGDAILSKSEVFEVTFKVKDDAKFGDTLITLKDVSGGTGKLINGIVEADDAELTISIKDKEEPPVPDVITSDVYEINNENKTISKIPYGTKISEFKENVTANKELVFVKDNEIITDENAVLENGMKVKIGETEYILIIDEKEPEPIDEYIKSDVYLIGKEKISEIPEGTTIKEFTSKVETNCDLVFIDKDGKVIEDENTVIESGMKVKVGKTMEFTLSVKEKEPEPPVEKYISSEVYDIKEEKVSKITHDTKVSDFIKNIDTNMEISLLDSEGKTLDPDSLVGTGMKLKADENEYVLVVSGDVDGDGRIGIDDIAKTKLHYIEKETLTGVYFEAADIDSNKEISINDLAQMKLIYIKKI